MNRIIFKYKTVLSYIIGMIFIYNCRSMWSSNIVNGGRNNKIMYIILLITFSLFLLATHNIPKNTLINLTIISIFFITYIGIYAFFSRHSTSLVSIIQLMIIILFFIWIVGLGYGNGILVAYKNLMVIIATISVFFWLIISVFHLIQPTGVFLSNWGSINGRPVPIASYYNLYFEPQYINTFLGTYARNCGIFTEAPMASLNYSLALLVDLFIQPKETRNHKLTRFLLVLAIITTTSTTGYLMLLFCLIFFFYKFNGNSKINLIKVVSVPIVCLVTIMVVLFLWNQKASTNSNSLSLRIDDYKIGFILWKQHPLFGVGLQNSSALSESMESWRLNQTGFSNSISEILANGGIYIGGVYILSFIYESITNWNKDKNKVMFILFTFFLFITTIFTYTYILLFLLVWMWLGYTKDINNSVKLM